LPVTNQGETSVANWRLKFQMKQATLTQSWNGTPEVTGASYTIVPPDWGRTIQPKQTVDFGFCATKSGPDYMPQQLTATS
jgi:endoglucanase